MNYEASNDSGRRPFRPDVTRGYWAAPSDFIYAGLGLGLRLDLLTVAYPPIIGVGISAIIPYAICFALFVVPLVVIQTFMGQFSSSGFISSLRLSPFFKSIGYIAMAVNLATLMYYSIFATVPLLFLINSFRPTLPWSCEAFATWGPNLTAKPISHLCDVNKTEYNETRVSSSFNSKGYHVPSVLYFGSHFGDPFLFSKIFMIKFSLSWEMILCNFLIWIIIAGIFYKFFKTEKIGKLIRYGVWITMGLLVLILIRVSFLHGSKKGLLNYFYPDLKYFLVGMFNIPFFVLSAFGVGWGSMISLGSFNKFKANIMSQSWYICLGQMMIFIAFDLLAYLIENHLSETLPPYDGTEYFYYHVPPNWMLLLNSGSVLARMEWSNMWCILIFFMLTVIALVFMIIHLYSLLTSVFDEFETLREHKMTVKFTMIGFLALCSSLCNSSSHGIFYFYILAIDAICTQAALNLLLLVMVLWIYGRERFQRDIKFMLGRRFGTWRVNMVRFISPLCLIAILNYLIKARYLYHYFVVATFLIVVVIIFFALPWLFVPINAVMMMVQTSGSLKMRFQRCYRPSDWYPVVAEDRQRYEDVMANFDVTHQLNGMNENVAVE